MTRLRSLGNIVKSKISSSFQERPFIENLVDKIVKATRGWQNTTAGDRKMKQVLRKTLLKYQLHKDAELFEKAYDYISEHY